MHIRRILNISKLVLVFVLLYAISMTATSIRDMDSMTAPISAKPSVQPIQYKPEHSPKLSIEDYAQIIKKNPFGTSNHTESPAKPPVAANPVSFDESFARQSGLTLMGTISGSRSAARAIIKNSENNISNFYKIGQFVGNARIDSIEDDAVVLFHDGQRKILPITSWASNSRVQTRHLTSLPVDTAKNNVVTANNMTQKRPETGQRKKIESVQEILAKTTFKPYIVRGQNKGLEITGLENMTFAKKIGLKNGDIISAVNGHRLTSKQKAYQIFKKARHLKTVSLDLIRDDKPKNILFALR